MRLRCYKCCKIRLINFDRNQLPSDILEYFITQEDIVAQELMDMLLLNYLDKHDAGNTTAAALVKGGIDVVCAPVLHR